MKIKKNDILFEVEVPDYEVPELPPVAIPIPVVESSVAPLHKDAK